MKKRALFAAAVFSALLLLAVLRRYCAGEARGSAGTYGALPEDLGTEDPLAYLAEDFTVREGFSTNLPLVVLETEGELAEYKYFSYGEEVSDGTIDPWTAGHIRIISGEGGRNTLWDAASYTGDIVIKKRGHTSFAYDKPQYLIKLADASGEPCDADLLGIGEGNGWVLNGSMADKSMLRNYLACRIASEASGAAMAPDCRFCEVVRYEDGRYVYQGVYLLMESVERGRDRIDIDEAKKKNVYTSYIVRRDRYTNFDPMLDTYGRINGLSEEWIGLKYPPRRKLTEESLAYIEADFSKTEQILYSRDASVFGVYDKYIDVDSFVDYFLINEFFGNYDAGQHSTYMYKESGGKLKIGPVWDFDQAMNNYYAQEMEAETLAFQTKPFFENLCRDKAFIRRLKSRYAVLRRGALSEKHVFSVLDQAADCLKSAGQREWFRWAADYLDDSFENAGNYYLYDYERDGITISRFNDDYEQELYLIRTYLHRHAGVIQGELTKLLEAAEYDTSARSQNGRLLLVIMLLFLVPSVLIHRKGA